MFWPLINLNASELDCLGTFMKESPSFTEKVLTILSSISIIFYSAAFYFNLKRDYVTFWDDMGLLMPLSLVESERPLYLSLG